MQRTPLCKLNCFPIFSLIFFVLTHLLYPLTILIYWKPLISTSKLTTESICLDWTKKAKARTGFPQLYIRTLIESSEKRYLRKHWELTQNDNRKSEFKIKNIEFYLKNAIIECSLSPNSFSNNLTFLLFNIRSMINLDKRKKLANFVNTIGCDFFFFL